MVKGEKKSQDIPYLLVDGVEISKSPASLTGWDLDAAGEKCSILFPPLPPVTPRTSGAW